jgi:DNA-binding NarL/FixJ family response regulator
MRSHDSAPGLEPDPMESAGNPIPSVLVAHPDESRRRTIRAGLEAAGLPVVADASTGDEALELALETRPAVCLLGLQLAGQSGLSVAAVVARVLDETSVIIMTPEPTVGDVLDAVKVGAAGCISSSLDPARLAAAVSAVAAGEASFPRLQLRQALDFLVPQVA